MEKAKLMQLEIENKRKLPKEIKDNISTNIFKNLLAAVIVMVYFCVVNFLYSKFPDNQFEQYMKYVALVMACITIIGFEISYRKNSAKLAFIGIELLACGILSLYIPYIYLHTSSTLRTGIMILPAILIVYYTIKSIIIFKQKQFEYQNNLSDIRQIVPDNEKVSYLDEKSSKLYREKIKQEEQIKAEIAKEQIIRKNKKAQMKKNKEQANKKTSSKKQSNNVKVAERNKNKKK